ncbi:membrane progestin receptor beta-like isoform X2 [Lineus longissimus]
MTPIETLPRENVPRPQWEPGVEKYYRLPYQPWTYYAKSILQLHNESGNVWTHFVAFFFFIVLIYKYHLILDFNREETWPLLMFGVSCMCAASGSSMAHLFHSKSTYVHYIAMAFDFAAVSLYSFASVCIVLYYSSDDELLISYGNLLMPLNAVLAFAACFGCSHGNTKYSLHHHLRRKLWYFIPEGSFFVACLAPAVIRFAKISSWDAAPVAEVESYRLHLTYFSCFAFGSFFFFSHIPELLFPGKFDIYCHSHQIWHFFGPVTIYFQFKTAYVDINNRQRDPAALAQLPSPSALWLYFVVVVIVNLLCIVYIAHEARKVVDKERLEIVQDKNKPAKQNPIDQAEKHADVLGATSPRSRKITAKSCQSFSDSCL